MNMNIFKVKELKNDFFIGCVVSLVLIVIIYIFRLNFIFDNLLESLGLILTISVTLSGFLITSLTILLVFPENKRIKFLKVHPIYKYTFHAFIISIVLFIGITILSFSFKILVPYTSHTNCLQQSHIIQESKIWNVCMMQYVSFISKWYHVFLIPLIILFIWAIISLFRCIWLLKKMIDVYFLDSEEKSQ